MALQIVKPSDPILTENLVITIFGDPGVGKTSTAFTADSPLLLDFDRGAQRAYGRKDSVIIKEWADIADLMWSDLSAYKTLVIDTVGRCLETQAAQLIKDNPKNRRTNSAELSMQGYGALKGAFARWISQCRSLRKDVVILCHAKEDKDGDNTVLRLEAMGASKDEIMKVSDLLGYMAPGSNGSTLNFNPTEKHSGKNCAGFALLDVPHFADNPKWMAQVIAAAKDHLNSAQESMLEEKKKLTDLLAAVEVAKNAAELNEVYGQAQNLKTPQIVKAACGKKAKSLGLNVDKKNKKFIHPVPNTSPQHAEDTSNA